MYLRLSALVIAIMMTVTPIAIASEGPPTEPGLPRACERSGNENPCPVIQTTHIPPGQTKIYSGRWHAVGTVTVEGTAVIVDANITFANTTDGFVASNGGTIQVLRSDLIAVNNSAFTLEAAAGTNFTLNDTDIFGGGGVQIATSAINVSGNRLSGMPVALKLADVTATVHHNLFVGNTVAVNLTGGIPTLTNNRFESGDICVKNWRTDPNILNNVFRRCHIGIYHEESHSVLNDNDMEDEANPPGSGIWIINGQSPIVENNVIRNYGTGIKITNARAYIRNNTIENNVGAGILVEGNSAPMDIQGNIVRGNGGDGIRLVNIDALPVFNNVVEDNTGDGISLHGSDNATLTGNVARGNGGTGIALYDSVDATLVDNVAESNARGVRIDALSLRADLEDTVASENTADGIALLAHSATVDGGSANGNGGHGVVIDHALGIDVREFTANGNGLDGFFIGGSQATIDHVNASENARNGFTYDPMGPLQILAPTPMTFVRALHNGVAGLVNTEGNTTSVDQGWWEGNGPNNAPVGVRNDDATSLIDARGSYWGAASGPRHPVNPLGTGDAAEGGVLFTPFRTTPPG